jgi:hypothetical protein
MYVWWCSLRYGYDQEETKATKDWIGRSLIPMIHGRPLGTGCTRIDQYLEFSPDQSIKVVDDIYWDRMIALNEMCVAPN